MLTRVLAIAAATGLLACTASPNEQSLTAPEAPGGAIVAKPMPSAPLNLSVAPKRIVFASCAHQNEDQSIWRQVAAEDADLVLYIGDNVYGDVRSNDPSLPELKAAYMRLAQSEPFAAVREAAPMLTVWDDHDYGLNDAGGDYVHREASEALFHHVWATPSDDPRRDRPGVYGAWYFGAQGERLQLIVLDTRYFRSPLKKTDDYGAKGKERYVPDNDATKTMLGAAQWAWLKEELKKPAQMRIIVSSVQVLADGHGWEAWKQLPAEREKLYQVIRDAGIDEIVFLTGDRHAAGYYEKTVDGLSIVEVTSSSLNLPGSRWREASGETYVEPGPNRMGGMIYDANYGVIDLDMASRKMQISVRGEDGEIIVPDGIDEDFHGLTAVQ